MLMQVDGKAGPYEWLTYRQVGALVEKVASGLASTGLQPKDKVAVYGSNAPEWMIAMQVRSLGLAAWLSCSSLCSV